jgi:hypothetical protein
MVERMNRLERLPLVGPFIRRRPQKNFLVALWDEVNRNLERYYVVEQRQFITEAFDIEAWEEARMFLSLAFPDALVGYAAAVRDFNAVLRDMKEFEGIYSSSIEKKTRENAHILHAKKEALDEQFQRLRPLIVSAQEALREMLVKYRTN